MREAIRRQIQDHVELVSQAADELETAAVAVANAVVESFRDGGRLYLFGNGGSAADAQHMAAEFVNRYHIERPPLPALALTTDSSVITAIANDYDFRDVFAKQLRALATAGDIVVGITTSGMSANVLAGLRAARDLGCRTVALVGRDGGEAKGLADIVFVAPHDDTARIQETHLLLEHLICDYVEHLLFKSPAEK